MTEGIVSNRRPLPYVAGVALLWAPKRAAYIPGMSDTTTTDLHSLSDDDLLHRLRTLARQSRRVDAELVAHIGEVDARGLYLEQARPSMHAYCVEVLDLTDAEAFLRITAARVARRCPLVLSMLADGRLHVSGVQRLAPHLTQDNHRSLLQQAAGKTRNQIEELVANLAPKPDVPAAIRKLPEPRVDATGVAPDLRPDLVAPAASPVRGPQLGLAPAGSAGSGGSASQATGQGPTLAPALAPRPGSQLCPDRARPSRPPAVKPLGAARYKVEFTASAELRDKLRRLEALMRASKPGLDLAAVIEAAVTEKLERLEARCFARVKAPRKGLAETDTRPRGRHIPAAVRRSVHQRDGGRCTFVDALGNRCTARHRLEFHHEGTPFGRGGDHSVGNIRLLCRSHNRYLAEKEYGAEVMQRYRQPRDGASEVREAPRGHLGQAASP